MPGNQGMSYSVIRQLCIFAWKNGEQAGRAFPCLAPLLPPCIQRSNFIKAAKSATNKGMSSRQAETSKINRHNSDIRCYRCFSSIRSILPTMKMYEQAPITVTLPMKNNAGSKLPLRAR